MKLFQEQSKQRLNQVIVEQKLLLENTARSDFRTFVKLIKPEFIFEDGNIIIIEELDNLLFGDVENLMIFAPPRFGKSELSSRLFPAFTLGVFSNWVVNGGQSAFEILLGSYSSTLASEFSASVQTYMELPVYKRIFPRVTLPPRGGRFGQTYERKNESFDVLCDTKTAEFNKYGKPDERFFAEEDKSTGYKNIKKCGSFKAVSKGGTVTGRGGNLIILDDMTKTLKEVESQTQRDSLFSWYQSALSTRAQEHYGYAPRKLILMTRWHEDDLPGRIISENEKKKDEEEKEKWRIVCLPAEAYPTNDEKRHPKDKRETGEHLSKRINIKKRKAQLSKYDFSALYQQDPVSEDGNIINIKAIKYYDPNEKIKFDLIVGGADLSFDALEDGSFCVFQKWGFIYNPLSVYLLDQIRDKMNYIKQKESLRHFTQVKHNDFDAGFWIEHAANAAAIHSEMGPTGKKLKSKEALERIEFELPFLKLKKVKDSKPVRLRQVVWFFDHGHVYLPKGDDKWIDDYKNELARFPAGKNDDQVDCTSLCLRIIEEKLTDIRRIEALSTF